MKRLVLLGVLGPLCACGSDGGVNPNDASPDSVDAGMDVGVDSNDNDYPAPPRLSLAVTVTMKASPEPFQFGFNFPTSHTFSLTVNEDGKGVVGAQGFAANVTMVRVGNAWRLQKPAAIPAPYSSQYGCGNAPSIDYQTIEIRAGSHCTGIVSGTAEALREDVIAKAPFTGTLTCVPDERPRFWTPPQLVFTPETPPMGWTGLPWPPRQHIVNKPLIGTAKATMVHVETGTSYPLEPVDGDGSVSAFREPMLLKRPGHYEVRADPTFLDFNGDAPIDSVLHRSVSIGPAIPVLADPGFDTPGASGLAINAVFVDTSAFKVIDGTRSLFLVPGFNNGGSAAFNIPIKMGDARLRFQFRRVWEENAVQQTAVVAMGLLGGVPKFVELPVHSGVGEPAEYQVPGVAGKQRLQVGPLLEADVSLDLLGTSIVDATSVYVFFVGRLIPACGGGVLAGVAPGILIDNLRVE